MKLGVQDEGTQQFLERVSATAIANQAILKCLVARVPLSVENVIYFVGDFVDPEDEDYFGVVSQIEDAIEQVLSVESIPSKAADGRHN